MKVELYIFCCWLAVFTFIVSSMIVAVGENVVN